MGKNRPVQIGRLSGGHFPKNRVITVIIFLFASRSMAQLTSSIQLGYTHDSNVFGNYAEVPDNYLALSLGIDDYVGWDYSALDMSYYGGLSSYNSYPEQDNWNHSLNLNYRIQLSRFADDMDSSEEASLKENGFSMPLDSLESYLTFAGIANRTVPHSGDFSVYVNYNTAAMGSLHYTIGKTVITHLRYAINYTGYDELPSLSNLENVGALSLAVVPARGIYLYVDGSYGNKKYYSVDTVSAAVKNLINMHSKGQYKGKGKSGNGNQAASSARTYLLDSPSASQATYGIGLNLMSGKWRAEGSFLIRKDVSGAARYINAVAQLSSVQSEVYDDPYSYQGNEFGILIKRDSLIAGINLSAGLKSARKDYNRPAFDTSQTVVVASERQDRFTDISIGLSKTFPAGSFPTGYTVSLTYDHIGNSSNDEFYKYTDDVVTLALSVNLL